MWSLGAGAGELGRKASGHGGAKPHGVSLPSFSKVFGAMDHPTHRATRRAFNYSREQSHDPSPLGDVEEPESRGFQELPNLGALPPRTS